jgi:predicted membrane protein
MLERPSFSIIGYHFISLFNNMGIVFWLLVIFIVFLSVKLVLYSCKSKVDELDKTSKLMKFILLGIKLSDSLSNYLAVHHIISLTSLTIYLWYEYYEKGCFELECLISDTKISSTKLVKFDIVISIILLIG